ncbi:substrate-binding periplasmic protein [Sulfurospirillum arcachonense]|uniref:substrate-binding periplasmic protein n=1 Tax=Sulfurospirillum arcachonense TaxID=57666 RepID=UPI00046996D0|nr:ABC transporter substrate-binding protein [Sulfurospirillum arcachonense]
MKKIIILFFCLGIMHILQANDIRMMTENYPPYNMEIDGELQGFSVDVLDAMLKQMNSKQKREDIELLPWSESYSLAMNIKNNMVFSTTRTKSRENLFKWVGPIYKTTVGVTALKSKNIVIKKISDLNKYKIGAMKKDIGETLLLEKGVSKSSIYTIDGINSLATSFYYMEKGKIDLLAYETKVAFYSIDLNGYEVDDYEVVYTLENNELYFAFNKQTSDLTIQKWQKALDEIKSNGIYNKIIKNY